MEAFDIGWIPKGWKKGEPLWVHNIQPIMKFILEDYVDIRTTVSTIQQRTLPKFPDGFDPDSIGVVLVRKGESEKCNKWLEWWRNGE